MEESCNNCKYQKRLILWERDTEDRYLPNYDKELTCCVLFDDVIYGHTEPHGEDSQCEMWEQRADKELSLSDNT